MRPAAVLLLLALPMSAAAGPRYEMSDTPRFAFPPPDSALLYVSREEFVRFNHLPPEHLYIDGAPLGLLPQQTYFWSTIPVGRHVVSGIVDAPPCYFECDSGQVCFLRLQETIDATDRTTPHLLLDDPQLIPRTVKQFHLKLVIQNDKGRIYLRGRAPTDLAPNPARVDSGPYHARLPEVMGNIWYESPLDEANLQRDFSNLRGHLTLAANGLQYRMTDRVPTTFISSQAVSDSLDIRADQVLSVRYGGTRFSTNNPWVDIIYSTPRGARMASFADARPEQADVTYNRIFGVVMHQLHARASAGAAALADSLASGAAHK